MGKKFYKSKKIICLILFVAVIILECLPFGVILNFWNPEGEPWRRTYSYFSLMPFGYANFGPLLTALLSCVLLLLSTIALFTKGKGLTVAMRAICGVALGTSSLPFLFGFDAISWVGVCITLLLVAGLIILCIQEKK